MIDQLQMLFGLFIGGLVIGAGLGTGMWGSVWLLDRWMR